MTNLSPASSLPRVFNRSAESLLDRVRLAGLSQAQARVDSFVASSLSQVADWRGAAALIAVPGALAGIGRFASIGRSAITLAKAPPLVRWGIPLLAGASLLVGCNGPTAHPEPPKTPEAAAPKAQVFQTDSGPIEYDPEKNPFAASPKLQAIAREIHGQGGDPILALFKRLKVGGPEGVRYVETPGYNLSGAQALERGGDCSDLGNLAIAAILELNRLGSSIRGGAYKVHFKGDPENALHIVPYVLRDGAPQLLDLQAGEPGKTIKTEFEILADYPSFAHAAALYHAEWGGYFQERSDWKRSMEAFRKSASIFGSDPRVARSLNVVTLNHHSDLAHRAYEGKQWSDCVRHSEEALSAAKALGDEAQTQAAGLERNGENCSKQQKVDGLNQAIQQGSLAFDRKDWPSCVAHFEAALTWLNQLPRKAETAEVEGSIQHNLSICRKK